MKTKWIKKLLCLLICLGMATAAIAQGNTSSVLERVQNVDDPELGELIRLAMENRKDANEKEAFEIMRKVTLSYVQIKLLDQQIAEVSRKIKAENGPTELQYELRLTKMELESKLMTELANLREVMGIIPRHPFEEQPINTLNTWLQLNVIDEHVYIVDGLKPFLDYWALRRWRSAGLLSEDKTLDYVRERLKNKNGLPIRIDIYYKPETNSACIKLRDAILMLARGANAEMQTEVRLESLSWAGSGESTFFLREGNIRTLHPAALQRPDGGSNLLTSGLVDPNDVEQHILWRLTRAKNVPLTIRIEYDEASASMAKQIAETAKAVAKSLSIAELVEVAEVLVKPISEMAFVGRWEALGKGHLQIIDIQTQGACQVIMGEGSQAIRSGARVKGTWLPTTKEILMDINDRGGGKPHYYYLGSINEKGNLVVNRAEIYLQGSLHFTGVERMIFKKVE